MIKYVHLEFKRLIRSCELWIVLITATIIALVGLLESALSTRSRWNVYETISSAQQHTLLYQSSVGTLAIACLIPILAALPNATAYVYEKRNNMDGILLVRCGSHAYFWGKAMVVAIVAFVVSCLPFLFNLFYCLIAYPLKPFEMGGGVVYNQLQNNIELNYTLFDALYLNHPVLDTLAHIGLIGCFGMDMALITYGISLYVRRNAIIPLVLPTVASLVLVLLLSAKGWSTWIVQNLLLTSGIYRDPSFLRLATVLIGMTALSFMLIFCKTIFQKDVLD